jgi:hypothetical protein
MGKLTKLEFYERGECDGENTLAKNLLLVWVLEVL